MYQIEKKGHDMGFLKKFMMENAGAAAVRRLLTKFDNVASKNILIFVGLGNNGGDGLVMARHLAGYGSNVTRNSSTQNSIYNNIRFLIKI